MASKGELTKERLVTEAARLIRRKGFTGTSVSDLTAATGVKKGSLYFHFPGKDELGLAVLERSRDRLMEFFDSALIGNTPGECLSNFFDAMVSSHRRSGFVGGCIFGNAALEMSDGNERYAEFVDRFLPTWLPGSKDSSLLPRRPGRCGETSRPLPWPSMS